MFVNLCVCVCRCVCECNVSPRCKCIMIIKKKKKICLRVRPVLTDIIQPSVDLEKQEVQYSCVAQCRVNAVNHQPGYSLIKHRPSNSGCHCINRRYNNFTSGAYFSADDKYTGSRSVNRCTHLRFPHQFSESFKTSQGKCHNCLSQKCHSKSWEVLKKIKQITNCFNSPQF